jgi:ribosomal protein S18 acetylase RimI-like enzyme
MNTAIAHAARYDAKTLLRRGTADDALCVGALAVQVFLDTYATAGIRPDLAREALTTCGVDAVRIRLDSANTHFILAERNQHLVGFAELAFGGMVPDASLAGGVELVKLYVQRHFKRLGVGGALLRHAESIAAGNSANCLWLTAWAENADALRFYAALGFVDIGQTEHVFEDKSYENRLLVRRFAEAQH